jgi:hypothetical protein
MLMLPPTYCTCLELYRHTTPAEVLAAAGGRDLVPVEPDARLDPEGAYLIIPDRLVRLGEEVRGEIRAARSGGAASLADPPGNTG